MKTILNDVLAQDLSVVFCGTAVGAASARKQAYYAGPGNAFWKTLFEVGLTPKLWEPEEYKSITVLKLGFTDLAKNISGNDIILRKSHFGRRELEVKVLRFRPHIVAFTSKRAAEEFLGRPVEYGLVEETIGNSKLFVLPSPSGAARRYWNVEHWRNLAKLAAMTPNKPLQPIARKTRSG